MARYENQYELSGRRGLVVFGLIFLAASVLIGAGPRIEDPISLERLGVAVFLALAASVVATKATSRFVYWALDLWWELNRLDRPNATKIGLPKGYNDHIDPSRFRR